jgi:hypothetical protein
MHDRLPGSYPDSRCEVFSCSPSSPVYFETGRPLAYFTKGPKDVATRVYNLNPAVANTFLVTVDRSVVANIFDIAPEQFSRVADATAEMLAGVH